jgi:hypothetical protein
MIQTQIVEANRIRKANHAGSPSVFVTVGPAFMRDPSRAGWEGAYVEVLNFRLQEEAIGVPKRNPAFVRRFAYAPPD